MVPGWFLCKQGETKEWYHNWLCTSSYIDVLIPMYVMTRRNILRLK